MRPWQQTVVHALAGAVALGVWPQPAPAQSAPDPHAAHLYEIPTVPDEILSRPIALQTGIGITHDQTSTPSQPAQRFYDQGLAYLHDYMWVEAARSFNQALGLDRTLILARVGLSDAYEGLNQPSGARAVLETIRSANTVLTEHDQAHIAVNARRMEAEAAHGEGEKMAAYRRALDLALDRFPSDVELWLQRGIAESPNPGDRGQGAVTSSIPYFQRALQVSPDHFAAHHYLVHAYENTGRVEEALEHGAAYARLAPEVPHARHMYGHDLRRVGRIREAVTEFETANRLETASFTSEKTPPEWDWHYEHNLDLLATSYQFLGQISKAEPLLRSAFALPTSNLIQALNKRQWPMFLRALGRGDDAMNAARVLIQHPNLVVQAEGHIEAAHVRLAMGDFPEAATEESAARAALAARPPGAVLATQPLEVLHGEYLLRTGQRAAGRAALEAAVRKIRAATGPDEWAEALFTLESIGRAAQAVGDWDFAAWLADQMRSHDAAYAGSHYALGLVADHLADRTTAIREFTLALQLWSTADPSFPALRDLRNRLNLSAP